MADESIPSEIARMSFEKALSELEDIVRRLEDGSGELDEGIKAYERGVMLKRHCENKLKDAQLRVDKVIVGSDGSLKIEPADIQ